MSEQYSSESYSNVARQLRLALDDAPEVKLTLVERYGADQWRRGNAGKEPQEFNEWQRDLEEWRQSERAAQRSEVQP